MRTIAWVLLGLLAVAGDPASAKAESSYRQFSDWSNRNPAWVPVSSHIALGAGAAYALRTQGASPIVSWVIPAMIGVGKEELLDKNASFSDMLEWSAGAALGTWLGGVHLSRGGGKFTVGISKTF